MTEKHNSRQDILLNAIQDMRDVCINMATGGKDFRYEKYEDQRAILMSFPELKAIIPDWLITHRFGSGYWSFIKKYASNYADRRTFLRDEFDDLTDWIKSGGDRPTASLLVESVEKIDSAQLMAIWTKIIERSKNDPEGAITACKSLLEATIKKILDSKKITYDKEDLPDLYALLKKELNMDPAVYDDQKIKRLFSGIISVIESVSSLRNDFGDAHGKSEADPVPAIYHVDLTINLSATLCAFLINVYLSSGTK